MTATIDTIREDFSFLDDWEDRYRYVIELGKRLPELSDGERVVFDGKYATAAGVSCGRS